MLEEEVFEESPHGVLSGRCGTLSPMTSTGPASRPAAQACPVTPIVLRPTPKAALGPSLGLPDHRGGRKRLLYATRWWGRMPDPVAEAAARFMLDWADADPTFSTLLGRCPVPKPYVQDSGDSKRFWDGPNQFINLVKAGVDPAVLLALRASTLTPREKFLVASTGISPSEALDLLTTDRLDLPAIEVLAALQRTA